MEIRDICIRWDEVTLFWKRWRDNDQSIKVYNLGCQFWFPEHQDLGYAALIITKYYDAAEGEKSHHMAFHSLYLLKHENRDHILKQKGNKVAIIECNGIYN